MVETYLETRSMLIGGDIPTYLDDQCLTGRWTPNLDALQTVYLDLYRSLGQILCHMHDR